MENSMVFEIILALLALAHACLAAASVLTWHWQWSSFRAWRKSNFVRGDAAGTAYKRLRVIHFWLNLGMSVGSLAIWILAFILLYPLVAVEIPHPMVVLGAAAVSVVTLCVALLAQLIYRGLITPEQ